MSHDEETLYLTLNCVYLIAVSRANGTVLWKSRFAVDESPCPYSGEHSTLPSVGFDGLIAVSFGWFVGVLAPNGTVISNVTLEGWDTNLLADMVAVRGAGYITTWARVLRYSYTNSSVVWQTKVIQDPVVMYTTGATLGRGGRTVYVADSTYVLALDARTGHILWNSTVGPAYDTAFYTSGVACECPPPYTVTRCNNICYSL